METNSIKDAPAFDFYPERWLAGVAIMSDLEQIAYLRLLCHQWLQGGLPNDLGALKRLAGKGATHLLLGKFPVGLDGLRRNEELELDRARKRRKLPQRFWLRVGRDDYNKIRRRAYDHTKKRSVRFRIFSRDGQSCLKCGSLSDLCLDHIIPLARGGDSSDENLQVLCRSCNSRKGCN